MKAEIRTEAVAVMRARFLHHHHHLPTAKSVALSVGQVGGQTGWAIIELTLGTAMDLSHFMACNKHTNVQLARTIFIIWFEADALCSMCVLIFYVIHMCV